MDQLRPSLDAPFECARVDRRPGDGLLLALGPPKATYTKAVSSTAETTVATTRQLSLRRRTMRTASPDDDREPDRAPVQQHHEEQEHRAEPRQPPRAAARQVPERNRENDRVRQEEGVRPVLWIALRWIIPMCPTKGFGSVKRVIMVDGGSFALGGITGSPSRHGRGARTGPCGGGIARRSARSRYWVPIRICAQVNPNARPRVVGTSATCRCAAAPDHFGRSGSGCAART
ncbi:MAG: hypothetical protein JWN95_1595 [Frankiales bacterium]|nr:hypothetical protein [Frankiales bacterium]